MRGLGLPRRAEAAPSWRDRLRTPVAFGRLVGIAIAVGGGLASTEVPSLTVGLLLAYAIASVPLAGTRASAYLDTAFAAGLLLALSRDIALFLPLSGVAAYNAGTQLGPLRGAVLGWSLSLAQLPALVPLALEGDVTVASLAAMVALHPVVAAAAGLAHQRNRLQRSDHDILTDTNRVLRELDQIADRVPAGLDPRSVTSATLEELVASTNSPRAFLFTGGHGILRPVASHGEGRNAIPVADRDLLRTLDGHAATVVDPSRMPSALRAVCGSHDRWLVASLQVDGRLVGALVAALPHEVDERRVRARVSELATDAALALENARLFSSAQSRAVDVARRRIAHDLHDGVAQSLAHIRMELDLLSRAEIDPEVVAAETKRLANVAGRALEDVRSTITGLRSEATEEGLVAAVRDHIEGLRGLGGPTIAFEAIGKPDLERGDADEILRIAQEATSNAVRHSGARNVLVSLEAEEGLVALVVEDDGIGIPPVTRRDGVGLRAMRTRAERLGAKLTIRDRRAGGTVVELSYQANRSIPGGSR